MKRPSSLELSPDGSRLVFAVKEYNLDKNDSVTHLWLLDTASGATRELTAADSTDGDPAWSPDGGSVAFVSKRGADDAASLYTIRADGGEAQKVLELPLSISSPRWMPDGRRIAFATSVLPRLAGDIEADEGRAQRGRRKQGHGEGHRERVLPVLGPWLTEGRASRLMVVDLTTGQGSTSPGTWDRAFLSHGGAVRHALPDGKWIAALGGDDSAPYRERENTGRLPDLRRPAGLAWRNLRPTTGDDGNPRFTADGTGVLFGRRTTYEEGENTELMRADLATGAVSPLFPGRPLDGRLADVAGRLEASFSAPRTMAARKSSGRRRRADLFGRG